MLKYKNSQVLNFNTLKDMVSHLYSNISISVVNESKITREPHTWQIVPNGIQ